MLLTDNDINNILVFLNNEKNKKSTNPSTDSLLNFITNTIRLVNIAYITLIFLVFFSFLYCLYKLDFNLKNNKILASLYLIFVLMVFVSKSIFLKFGSMKVMMIHLILILILLLLLSYLLLKNNFKLSFVLLIPVILTVFGLTILAYISRNLKPLGFY